MSGELATVLAGEIRVLAEQPREEAPDPRTALASHLWAAMGDEGIPCAVRRRIIGRVLWDDPDFYDRCATVFVPDHAESYGTWPADSIGPLP